MEDCEQKSKCCNYVGRFTLGMILYIVSFELGQASRRNRGGFIWNAVATQGAEQKWPQ